MKAQKIKRYRMPVSVKFPKRHPKAGEETYFTSKIRANNILDEMSVFWEPKLHTIRANYELWKKRMGEVQRGEAVIDLYYWDGKPYGKGVKQVVFATLDKDSGCGVQRLEWYSTSSNFVVFTELKDQEYYIIVQTDFLAKNDGLSLEDFKAWFKGYDLSQPMAIIHFTPFRY